MDLFSLNDLPAVLRAFKDAIPLLWRNKLWKGYFSHGPVSYISILLVLLVSFKTYEIFRPNTVSQFTGKIEEVAVDKVKDIAAKKLGESVVDSIEKEIQSNKSDSGNIKISLDTLEEGLIRVDYTTDTSNTASVEADTITTEPSSTNESNGSEDGKDAAKGNAKANHVDKKSIFSGGSKYLSIILLNMLIAHFCGRIIGMMGGFEKKIGLKGYINSQIRILKVGAINWAFEIGIGILLSIVCGIFLSDGYEKAGKTLIQMFFLGYLFFDSYNDYFGFNISDSRRSILNHLFPVTLVGAIAFAVMSLPYAGAIAGPILCSVGATIYLAREKGLNLKS